MKRMKRVLAMLLAAMLLLALAACGGDSGSGEGEKTPVGSMGNNAGGNVQETQQEETKQTVSTTPEVGGTILFGSYEQDNDTSNGAEPIEWKILDEDETGYFLMSKYILDSKMFHEVEEPASWENSTIRQWLNNDFYNTAFSEEEKASIRLSQVINEVGEIDRSEFYEEKAADCAATEDYVYLLNVHEVVTYFPCGNSGLAPARRMVATDYAKSLDLRVGETLGCSAWLLRNVYAELDCAVTVERDTSLGYARYHGRPAIYGIAPVIWVEKDSFVPAQGDVYVAKEGPVEFPTEDYTNAEGITFVNMTSEELLELSKELYPIYSAGNYPEKEYYVQVILRIPVVGECEENRTMATLNYYRLELQKEDGSVLGVVDVQGRFLKEEYFGADANAAGAALNAEEYAALVAKMDLYEELESVIVRGKIIECEYNADYTFRDEKVGEYQPYLAVMEIERLR